MNWQVVEKYEDGKFKVPFLNSIGATGDGDDKIYFTTSEEGLVAWTKDGILMRPWKDIWSGLDSAIDRMRGKRVPTALVRREGDVFVVRPTEERSQDLHLEILARKEAGMLHKDTKVSHELDGEQLILTIGTPEPEMLHMLLIDLGCVYPSQPKPEAKAVNKVGDACPFCAMASLEQVADGLLGCPSCHADVPEHPCPICNGTGQVIERDDNPLYHETGMMPEMMPCPDCYGRGRLINAEVVYCRVTKHTYPDGGYATTRHQFGWEAFKPKALKLIQNEAMAYDDVITALEVLAERCYNEGA